MVCTAPHLSPPLLQMVEVQPADGYLTMLPLETLQLDVIVSPDKAGVRWHNRHTHSHVHQMHSNVTHSIVHMGCMYAPLIVSCIVLICVYSACCTVGGGGGGCIVVHCLFLQPFSFKLTCMSGNGRCVNPLYAACRKAVYTHTV